MQKDSEGTGNSDTIDDFLHKPELASSEDSVNLQQASLLSKNALKKLRKRQHWEETRDVRKAAQKEKDKRKKLEKRKATELGLVSPPIRKPKVEQIASEMRIVIDLSFDAMMTDAEITSVTSQLTRCYSANRSTTRPVNLFFTSCGGRVQERFNTKLQDHINWKQVVFDNRPYLECFGKEDLVYLTADATDIIKVLDESKVYIIGGIVDKNRHKNICFDKAKKEGIATGQLPIGNYIQLSTRKVLTINHVFEILVRWLEYKDWEKAFLEVIPKRKFNEEGKKQRRRGKNNSTNNMGDDNEGLSILKDEENDRSEQQ